MAIEFIRVQRNIQVGPNPGLKYLAVIKRGKKVQMEDIYKDITDLSSLSRGDIKNTIDNFMLVVGKYFKDGRSVDMEEFGEFQVNLRSKAMDSLEEVTSKTIKTPSISFRMGKELKRIMEETPKVLGSLEAKGYQP
ncbi:MAG: HU family DNA-binding protein [Bacteroidales bacterium]|jgi:predicted histone-like DNA-binding protein|nr:HU family DNA-binding protein [Bacteroidales bacterium]MDD4684348.1 HU family DNA-binding protein [Bacteroidales bacterium]